MQGFVRNQGDGWGWTLDFLARTVEELAVIDADDAAKGDIFATYASFAAATGRRLGELHATLAAPTEDAAFAPYEVTSGDLRAWAEGVVEMVATACTLLRNMTEWPDEATAELARGVLNQQAALVQAVHRLAASGQHALATRVHGDFHLGQVLFAQSDAYIIDFEGEPARPMEQRRAKSCPLKDVAGLLRSFDYAAAAAAPGRVAASAQTSERRGALLEGFRTMASATALKAYREVLDQAPIRWVPKDAEDDLLDLFLIEKAAYEIRYEAANRPTWLAIPLRGLARIATRVLGPEELPA
jgi:maltose alpha-D-glucosyltransferase/alpha-amylase